jgi:hypothetical protein
MLLPYRRGPSSGLSEGSGRCGSGGTWWPMRSGSRRRRGSRPRTPEIGRGAVVAWGEPSPGIGARSSPLPGATPGNNPPRRRVIERGRIAGGHARIRAVHPAPSDSSHPSIERGVSTGYVRTFRRVGRQPPGVPVVKGPVIASGRRVVRCSSRPSHASGGVSGRGVVARRDRLASGVRLGHSEPSNEPWQKGAAARSPPCGPRLRCVPQSQPDPSVARPSRPLAWLPPGAAPGWTSQGMAALNTGGRNGRVAIGTVASNAAV